MKGTPSLTFMISTENQCLDSTQIIAPWKGDGFENYVSFWNGNFSGMVESLGMFMYTLRDQLT